MQLIIIKIKASADDRFRRRLDARGISDVRSCVQLLVVIPAKAGSQISAGSAHVWQVGLDARFRGHDEGSLADLPGHWECRRGLDFQRGRHDDGWIVEGRWTG